MRTTTTRRLGALLGAAAVSLTLTACGGGDKSGDGAKKTTATATTGRTTTTANRTRTSSRADQGGAQVEGGPGSASLNPTPEGGVAAVGVGSTSATGVIRPFSDQSPWNTAVDAQPLDRRSATWITQVRERIGVVETANGGVRTQRRIVNDGLFVNTRKFTTPIVDETDGVATRVICRQLPPYCGDGANITSLIIPPDVDPLPQYDGWFTVLNRSEGVAYDLWRARRGRDTTTISYQFLRKWDLNGPGFQEPNTVSARGSGLPLFAGVILPEEIQSGRIDHALAISLPGPAQRTYVQPASATDGNGRLTSMPEGTRIRLKRGVQLTFRACPANYQTRLRRALDTTSLADDRALPRCFPTRTNRRAARAIFEALRRYGAIVVDRSRVPSMYAKLNFDWSQPLRDERGRLLDGNFRPLSRFVRRLPNQATPLLRGNEVEQLQVEDFEVVGTRGAILRFPPLGNTSVAGTTTGAGTGPTATTGTTASGQAPPSATGAARPATTATQQTFAPAPSTTTTTQTTVTP